MHIVKQIVSVDLASFSFVCTIIALHPFFIFTYTQILWDNRITLKKTVMNLLSAEMLKYTIEIIEA